MTRARSAPCRCPGGSPPRVRRGAVPGLERRPRCSLCAQERARRRVRARLAPARRAAGGHRGRAPPGRLLVRRLPALRGDGAVLADHGRGQALRRGGRPRARRLQRLPGALRVRAAPGRAGPQPSPALRLRLRARARRRHAPRLHLARAAGPAAAASRQARGGRLLRCRPRRSRELERASQIVLRYCEPDGSRDGRCEPERRASRTSRACAMRAAT